MTQRILVMFAVVLIHLPGKAQDNSAERFIIGLSNLRSEIFQSSPLQLIELKFLLEKWDSLNVPEKEQADFILATWYAY